MGDRRALRELMRDYNPNTVWTVDELAAFLKVSNEFVFKMFSPVLVYGVYRVTSTKVFEGLMEALDE